MKPFERVDYKYYPKILCVQFYFDQRFFKHDLLFIKLKYVLFAYNQQDIRT